MMTFRITVSLATLLASIAMFTVFFAAPYAGSAYEMMLGQAADHLPRLTASFSLPLLRPHAADAFSEAMSALWVWVVWAVVLGCIPATLVWTLFATDLETALARWTGGISLSLSLILIVAVFTLSGLLMPWFPL